MQFPEQICEGTAFKVHRLGLSVIFVQFRLHKYRVGISAGKKALQAASCLFGHNMLVLISLRCNEKNCYYSSTSLIQHLFEEQKRAFQILLIFLCFPF